MTSESDVPILAHVTAAVAGPLASVLAAAAIFFRNPRQPVDAGLLVAALLIAGLAIAFSLRGIHGGGEGNV